MAVTVQELEDVSIPRTCVSEILTEELGKIHITAAVARA